MVKISLKYKLNETAIQGYVVATWGSSKSFPIKNAFDTIMEELTKQDKKIVLNVSGDFTDPKYFPKEFDIERKFDNDEVYTVPLKKLIDIVTETTGAIKGQILPYDLVNNFMYE